MLTAITRDVSESIHDCELSFHARRPIDVPKAMAQKAREENEQLKQRVALLEEVLDELEDEVAEPPTPRPVRRTRR